MRKRMAAKLAGKGNVGEVQVGMFSDVLGEPGKCLIGSGFGLCGELSALRSALVRA